MNTVNINVTLDLVQQKPWIQIPAKQYDDAIRHLIITITNDGQPYTIPIGATVRFIAKKPDHTNVMLDAALASSKVDVELTEQVLAVPGLAACEIEITDTTGTVSSANFVLQIQPQPVQQRDIQSSDDYQSIDAIKQQTQQYMQAAQNAAGDAEDAKDAAAASASAASQQAQNAQLAAEQVQKIVAGNEAYTKAESDLKYATAPYKTTTGSGYVVVEDGDNGTAEVGFFGNSFQYESTGKNILPFDFNEGIANTVTRSGVTFTKVENGGIHIKGANNDSENSSYCEICGSLTNYTTEVLRLTKKYYLKGPIGNNVAMLIRDTSGSYKSISNNSEELVNVPIGCVYVQVGRSYVDTTIYPMISYEDVPYEPYSGGEPGPNPDYPFPVQSVGDIPKDTNGKEIRNLLDEAGVMANTVSSFSANGTLRFSAELIGEKADDFGLTVGGKAIISSGTPTSSGTFAASGTVAISVTGNREDLKNYRVMITDAATIDAYRPYIGENNGLLRVVNTTGSEQRDGWIQLKEPLRKVGDIADSIAPDGTVVQSIGITKEWTKHNDYSKNGYTCFVGSPNTGVYKPNAASLILANYVVRVYAVWDLDENGICISSSNGNAWAKIAGNYDEMPYKDFYSYAQLQTPITYTTPMPDFITGEGVTTFLTPDGEVVPDIFVRYKQTVKGAALEMIEDDKNRKIYGVSITKQENGNIQSSPTLTRTDDAVGLTAQATTNGAAVTNDFDTAADWPKMFRCNGFYSDTGQFIITAKKGEPGFDAVGQDVYWCCQRFYHKRTETTEAITHQISTKMFPGAQLPTVFTGRDGEALDYWVTGAYEGAVQDSKIVSRSGIIPGGSISMNTGVTYCRNVSPWHHLGTTDMIETLRLLIMIEFATLNTQTAIGPGATGMRYSTDQATVTVSSGNKFVCANSVADQFVVGQTIAIGTSAQGSNVANNRIITSITTHDSNNKAINFDGAAVTVTAGNYISSRPWKTGDTDSITASSGSKAASKRPAMYRGYENPFGNTFEVMGDAIFHNGSNTYYKCTNPDKWTTPGDLTDDYIPLPYKAPTAEGYCMKLGYDPRFPYTALTEKTGASSSTYYCDYFYRNPPTTSPDTLREVLNGGSVSTGVLAGLSYWYLADAVSYSYWSLSGRLSATGRGGPGDTMA